MVLIANNPETGDRFPIYFRPNCDRTWPSSGHPEGEGLLELTIRLNEAGYRLVREGGGDGEAE